MGKTLTVLGGAGGVVGLLCCFTGLLPIVLTAAGATGLIPILYKDSVLLPFAAVSLIVMGLGLWMMRRATR